MKIPIYIDGLDIRQPTWDESGDDGASLVGAKGQSDLI